MALERATFSVTTDALEYMVLDRAELPEEFHRFQVVREGPLDNAAMAEHGFSGNTAERFSAAGRVTGFLRNSERPLPPSPTTASTSPPPPLPTCSTTPNPSPVG